MIAVFVDTSFLVALMQPRDPRHRQAQEIANHSRAPMLTTEYVVLEVGNFLARANTRRHFQTVLDLLENTQGASVVAASRELFRAGRDLYLQRPDKDWSLTDCISFVVMQEHGLTEALTADRHFEQAGFSVLLK